MTESHDPRLVNIVGALALALADGLREATETAAGMSGSAPSALVALDQFLGGATTENLAQAIGLTHSGAVRLADRLVELGFVERRPGPDARSGSIVLTARGRTASHKVAAARATVIDGVLHGLGSEDRTALELLVERLLTTITAERLSARRRGDPPNAWLCRLCDFTSCGRPEGQCPAANAAQADMEARRTKP